MYSLCGVDGPRPDMGRAESDSQSLELRPRTLAEGSGGGVTECRVPAAAASPIRLLQIIGINRQPTAGRWSMVAPSNSGYANPKTCAAYSENILTAVNERVMMPA